MDGTGGVDLYLHGTGATANPPTLTLNSIAPTETTTKYRDSVSVNFSGGNPWQEIGVWTTDQLSGQLTALTGPSTGSRQALHVWLGLKNSDDIGTRFDLRAEMLINDQSVTSGETWCITNITRNANQAREVAVEFDAFDSIQVNSGGEVSLKVSTRVSTDGAGDFCGGHSNAVGLRLYFDRVSRPARFGGASLPAPMPMETATSTNTLLAPTKVTPSPTIEFPPPAYLPGVASKVAALPQFKSDAPVSPFQQPFDKAQDEQSTTTTIDHAYDPLREASCKGYRLTEANHSTCDDYHHSYDSVGNRLTEESKVEGLFSAVGYVYDEVNCVTSVSTSPTTAVDGVAFTRLVEFPLLRLS